MQATGKVRLASYLQAHAIMCTYLCVVATRAASWRRVTRVCSIVIVGGFCISPRINDEGCVVYCNPLGEKVVFTDETEGGGADSTTVPKLTIQRVCLCNPSKFFIVHLQV